MPKKMKDILKDPKIVDALDRARSEAQKISVKELNQGLLKSPGIANAMIDILESSSMSESQKEFIRLVFVERMSKAKAVEEVFGKAAVPTKELISMGILNQPAVKEFLELIKLFYIEASPLAALTELKVMLDEKTEAKDKLAAAKQIKSTAGLAEDSEQVRKALPVQININMPGQVPVIEVQEAPIIGEISG